MSVTAAPPAIVRIGRPFPHRSVWVSVAIAAALMIGFGVAGLTGRHPEQTPLVLLFLLIPAAVIPSTILLNQYAEIDTATWLIRVNGGEPRPLAHLTHGRVSAFRGVCTLDLGYSDRRADRFSVSSNTPFGSPRIERDWMRYLLPYTGLPREPASISGRYVSLERAQAFATEWLK